MENIILSFFEYGIYIVVLSTMIVSYNKYKKSEFSQERMIVFNVNQKASVSFKNWLKEIYIIRARKRPWLSLLPQLGVIVSFAGLLVYPLWTYLAVLNPIKSFEELKRYEGKVIGYKYNRKSQDRLIVQLHNGEKKYYIAGLVTRRDINEHINKNITVWVQEEKGLLDYGEKVIWRQYDSNIVNLDKFNKHYFRIKELQKIDILILIIPLKCLFIFMFLLWLINRNPIKSYLKEVKNGNN